MFSANCFSFCSSVILGCIRFKYPIDFRRSNVMGCIRMPARVLSLDNATNVHPAAISLLPMFITAL